MKGFSFISYLTYPLNSSEQEIQNYTNFDGFPYHKLDTQNRFVIYRIDNSQYICLNDLLEFQKMKFIKLTRAQLLQLCLDLISKLEEMQRMNFKHNFIQTDRIWLKMKQIKKNQIKIKRRKIFYSIHILGYQSPFYEQIDYQPQNDEQSIKQIIKDILNLIKVKWETKKKQKIIQNSHFKKLLYEFSEFSLDQFKFQVYELFKSCNNDQNVNQYLNGIEEELNPTIDNKNYQRNRRSGNVTENLQKLEKVYYKEYDFYSYQLLLNQTLPKIVKEFLTAIKYENQKPPNNLQQNQIKQLIEKSENDLMNYIIQSKIEEYQKSFKFNFDQTQIINDIQPVLNERFKCLYYFYNSIKFNKDAQNYEMQEIQLKMKQDILKEVIHEYLEIILQENILELDLCLL